MSSDTDSLSPQCFNPGCDKQFDTVNDMVAVPGRGGRSPRHFCEDCAERIQRGPPMTDGGEAKDDFDPSDIDLDEPPEMPDPPMYEEWEDVETWSKANLRYPVPGGWGIDDHGKFHTTWIHEDGATLTRSSKRTPGPKDTFAFKLNGEEIHRVDTGPERVEMREETVWLLTFYDENEGVDSPASFQQQIREERNASLGDFA